MSSRGSEKMAGFKGAVRRGASGTRPQALLEDLPGRINTDLGVPELPPDLKPE
jgi:hypothetical protein